jgi:uncharacterized Tic20 family protein
MTISKPSSPDDHVLAALAHLLGLWVALIVWIIQKDKSPYVRFQAVQSMAFSLVELVFMALFFGCFFGVFFVLMVVFLGTSLASAQSDQFPLFAIVPMLFPLLTPALVVPIALAPFIARMVAAINTVQGKDFRYPWLGKWVEKFLA